MDEPFPFAIHRHIRETRGSGTVQSTERKHAYKKYDRMPTIPLSKTAIEAPLSDALKKRSSAEHVNSAALKKEDLGALLHTLAMREDGSRPYPSGGALYPIETYVLVQRAPDIPLGVHHYQPESHALEHLWDRTAKAPLFVSNLAWAEDASAIVVFTGLWHRNYAKYRDFAYLLGLLEAGHMAQNILLASAALNLPARPLAGFNDEVLSSLLDLDEEIEQPVYAIALGGKAGSK